MQFQYTLGALLRGEKTETSRIVKPGDDPVWYGERPAPWLDRSETALYSMVWSARLAQRFVVDQTYAIQPGRAIKSVGRVKVLGIWQQDVRTLTPGQVQAEGFDSLHYFLFIWTAMHDKKGKGNAYHVRPVSGDSILNYLNTRPAERYMAWRMTVQVLWETVDWTAAAKYVKPPPVLPISDLMKGLSQQERRDLVMNRWVKLE